MDSLEGSIAVNQVFYAKYALRRLSSGGRGAESVYLTEVSQEKYF